MRNAGWSEYGAADFASALVELDAFSDPFQRASLTCAVLVSIPDGLPPERYRELFSRYLDSGSPLRLTGYSYRGAMVSILSAAARTDPALAEDLAGTFDSETLHEAALKIVERAVAPPESE